MTKIKLCIVTPSFSGGGAERIAVNLANYYSGKGFNVSLLAFKATGPYANQVSDKVKLIDLNVTRTRYVFFKLFKELKKEQPSHVLSVIRGSNIVLGFVSVIAKPYTLVFRESTTLNGIISMSFMKRSLYKTLMKLSYSLADRIISNSEDTKDDLVKNRITSLAKTYVIGNPVLPCDYKLKMNKDIDHSWFISKNIKVVLSVGRLHTLKNHQLLIRSFHSVSKLRPDLRLVILGEGDQKEKLENLAKNLGLSDKFEIISFQKNPYPYYKNADLFVLTSDWEGFGNVLVEALACGVPVISTDCPGGPKTILKEGRIGTLVPVGDEEALTSAIVKHFKKRGCSNDDWIYSAEKYTVQSIAEQYFKLLIKDR